MTNAPLYLIASALFFILAFAIDIAGMAGVFDRDEQQMKNRIIACIVFLLIAVLLFVMGWFA